MSRKLRAVVALLLVSFAFSAMACAGSIAGPHGPSSQQVCDTSNSNTC